MTRGKRPPTAWRRLAVKCYHGSEDNMANTVKAIKAQIKGKCMGRPKKYIARWAAAFQNKGTVEDGGHKGRHRMLDDAQAEAAADIFCQGYKQKGASITLHYLSVQEGISKSIKLQQIQQETGACDRTILRSMKRVLPTLCMRTQRFSQTLSTSQRKEPLRVSKIMVKKTRSFFKRIIWIDAAKFYIDTGPPRRVWVDSGRHNLLDLVDGRAPGKRGQHVCLAYYRAVSEDLGPVHIQLTSGTKGCNGRHLKSFKVHLKSVDAPGVPESIFFNDACKTSMLSVLKHPPHSR
jgi:hypothetical protein